MSKKKKSRKPENELIKEREHLRDELEDDCLLKEEQGLPPGHLSSGDDRHGGGGPPTISFDVPFPKSGSQGGDGG